MLHFFLGTKFFVKIESWNFVRFHLKSHQKDAENFSFLAWQTKKVSSPQKKCGMLVIETLKCKISDFLNSNMCFCSQQYSVLFLQNNSNSNSDWSESKLPFFIRRTKKYKIVLEWLVNDWSKMHTIAPCLAWDFWDLGKFSEFFSVICQARTGRHFRKKITEKIMRPRNLMLNIPLMYMITWKSPKDWIIGELRHKNSKLITQAK